MATGVNFENVVSMNVKSYFEQIVSVIMTFKIDGGDSHGMHQLRDTGVLW